MNDVHLLKTGANKGKRFYGVQTVSGDSERVRGWDLMTHGGFITYPHHDACGLCTYVTPRSGSKIWVYLDTMNSSSANRTSLFKDWDDIFMASVSMSVPDVPLGALVLQRGDTLYA